MTTPSPISPTKGAGTTLWLYTGTGDPYADPTSDTNWTRLAQIKDLTPGEITADSYDDTYLDDPNADWKNTAQGEKSAGDASFTLAWKPGETGQQGLVAWFNDGSVRGYKVKYPNSAIDVYKGWVSSLGKTVPAKEVITRAVKITNVGKPSLAEEGVNPVINVTGVTVAPTTMNVEVGESANITVTIMPANASDQTFKASSTDETIATVNVVSGQIEVYGVKAGSAQVIAISSDGQKTAICAVTITPAT